MALNIFKTLREDDLGNVMDADFTVRKRHGWSENVSLASQDIDLLDDDDDLVEEEEDGVGCPLPSTPEDTQLLEAEMTEVLKAGVLSDEIDLGALAHNAAEQAEEFVRKVWEGTFATYTHMDSEEGLY